MRRLAQSESRGLLVRTVTALCLAPPVLVALYFGPPYSDALVLLAGTIVTWEWAQLLAARGAPRIATTMIPAVALALLAATIGQQELARWVLAVGAMFALWRCRHRTAAGAWAAFGILYLGAACLSFLWLRSLPDIGLSVALWLIAAVWATDIGAYLVGQSLGGPLLAPRISPRKTWSGLAGGMAAAAGTSAALALALPRLGTHLGFTGIAEFLLAGLLVASVAQIGDLLESAFKRHVGAKNSSNLIPGHGGLLDRVDGLLAASLAMASVVALIKLGA